MAERLPDKRLLTDDFVANADPSFVEPYKDLKPVKMYINRANYPNMKLGATLKVADFNAQELAQIAVSTAETARTIAGIEPRVAMLSFSTKGSAKHELIDKVTEATRLAKEMAPDLQLDGELQADAALIEKVGASKAPGSPVAGKANVLVFPDLQAGNIGYKLVERFSGADAVGPILQGIAKPVNDLSRGCKVQDIVQMVIITANQAMG